MADWLLIVLPRLEAMQPDSILDRVHEIEKYDRLARRNYGVSDKESGSGALNLNVLAGRGRMVVAIDNHLIRRQHKDVTRQKN